MAPIRSRSLRWKSAAAALGALASTALAGMLVVTWLRGPNRHSTVSVFTDERVCWYATSLNGWVRLGRLTGLSEPEHYERTHDLVQVWFNKFRMFPGPMPALPIPIRGTDPWSPARLGGAFYAGSVEMGGVTVTGIALHQSIPLALSSLASLLFLRAFLRLRERARRLRAGECLKCGYSLQGNLSGICPECGTPAVTRDS